MTRMCFRGKQRRFLPGTAMALLLSTVSLETMLAQTAPSLGTAASFAALGGSTVTNTGSTVINGNLGVSPGGAVTGFPPGVVVPPGTIHVGDAVAAGAQSDNTIAYNALAGQTCNVNLSGQDLGGLTLTPGVYCFATSAQLTGTLTLDAQGNPGAVFIFQIGSTLTTATSSSVNVINGGSLCNLFWQVGSSATLGTTTAFEGNILALTSITLTTGATVSGRTLAQNGAVTLDGNGVSLTACNASFVAPPAIVNAFGLAAIGVGGSTTKSFTITNPNATVALAGISFTDTLPAGLVVSTPNGLGSCDGGTTTAVAGSGTVSLAGATLPGGGSCTFSVSITGTAPGTYNNSATVSSGNGGTGNNSTSSLTVLPTPPVISPPTILKTFGAAGIGVGGTTTLTFTINNPNAAIVLTGVSFTDALPAGLAVSTPNGQAGSCDGGTIAAVAGSGTVSLAGAIFPGGGSCTFSVNVTGTAAGVMNNSVSVSSTNGGAGNTSLASLNVVPAAIAPPTIVKSFGPVVSISTGGSTVLSFSISNPNSTVALAGVAFTDILPTGLVVATPNGLAGPCGGGVITATAGSGSISLTGATLAASASCTFSVIVTATGSGVLINVTGNVTSSNGGVGNTASAQLVAGNSFQVNYAANLQTGDSFINIVNTGANGANLLGPGLGGAAGNICVNVYTFSPDEEMESCCSCLVTPNGLASLSVVNDLTAKTLTGSHPSSVVVNLLATLAGPGGSGTSCTNSAASVNSATIVPGMAAWRTTVQPSGAGFAMTEASFASASLSAQQLASLAGRCGSIIGNGSGYGMCLACQAGAR